MSEVLRQIPAETRPLAELISAAPAVFDAEKAAGLLADLNAALAGEPPLPAGAHLVAVPPVRALITGIFGASPYLSAVVLRNPAWLTEALAAPPGTHLEDLGADMQAACATAENMAGALRALRVYKARAALLVALADLGGVWPVMTAAEALSDVADRALGAAVRFLLAQAGKAGTYRPDDAGAPDAGSGLIVIGMGKYGARELNYSSDIDLIVFFDRAAAAGRLKEALDPQSFFVRLTRDLVRLMQERTEDGYVFRTDLRLRPDPGATQVALSRDAALHYYESFGQNWERAALIKARPVAGDLPAGIALLKDLAPYIWRKYLDYAAIADIHAMKRQIHAFKGFGAIGVAGHNIKLGRGGIREIEFFAQTQQLIAGGRQQELRAARTLVALERLAARQWISAAALAELGEAYCFLRMVEHRLQMIADEQTQTLPAEPEKLERVARFCGFDDRAAFGGALTQHLMRVQAHYARLFEDVPELTSSGGNLVFTGDDADPATVATLEHMGFKDANAAIDVVKGWHFGRYPAMRSARARELLTEFQPVLLEALARSAEPHLALLAFDRFLAELPAGVQLFSLLKANPNLTRLIADIMGTAPRLAQELARRARSLDAVLDPGFFGADPSADGLKERIHAELVGATDQQERLDRVRVVGREQAFLIGVRLLSGSITAAQAGHRYAVLAETLIAELASAVGNQLEHQHGRILKGTAAVLAMGKLGGREMAADSDIDLIVIYDHDARANQSDGARPLSVQQFYSRYTQRLISAMAAQTAEGRLYEVDMRLRPSGNAGPVASHLQSFTDYQNEAAWTWEHMALTRARVLTGTPALRQAIERTIRAVLTRRRDAAKLATDVREMRDRIAAEKGSTELFDLKQTRGGLVDLEFIVQYLQLLHAHAHPQVLDQTTATAFEKLAAAGVLSPGDADILLPAATLYQSTTQVLRLCLDSPFDRATAPSGLKALIAQAAGAPDFARAETLLAETQEAVAALYERLVA